MSFTPGAGAIISFVVQGSQTAQRQIQSISDSFGGVSAAAKASLKELAAFAGVGLSLGAIAEQAISAQREFDILNASLVTATGSTTSAGEAFKALQAFAATTPYSVHEATEAFIKMRNLGLDPSEKALRAYGNTASAMGKGLDQMVEAVADAASGEFERLKEFGIKSQVNGAQVSLTFKGITKNIGNNAEEIQAYLQKLGEIEFGGGMERRAATLDGAISNLGDTWQTTLRSISSNGFGEGVMSGVMALSGALTDLSAILGAVGGAAHKEGEAVKEASGLHTILTMTFEALAAVGVNVAFVFQTIGKDIGTFAAQASVLFDGGMKGLVDGSSLKAVQAMGRERVAEAELERKAVDAKTEAVLGASAKAQAARNAEDEQQKKSGTDRLAQYKADISADEKRTNAMNALIEVRKKLLGIDTQDQADMKKIQTALDTGAISQAEYNRLKGQLSKQIQASSLAYKEEQKSLDSQVASIQRVTEALGLLNQRQLEHIQFQKGMGQISEESAINQSADVQIKSLGDQIAAQEKLLGVAKKRQDSQKEQGDILGKMAGLRTQIDNAQAKREEDLIALDDRQYREAIGHYADLLDAAQAQAKAEQDRVRDQQDEIDQLGMTSKQIAEVTAQRLADRAVMLDQLATIRDMQDASGELGVEARKQAAALRAQASQVMTKEEITRQKELWGQIESTAHDTFISIFDSGKSAFDRLRDALKNGLLELLYQMTLKKWILNVGASVSSPSAVGGLASTGNSLLQGGGSLSSLYGTLTGGMTAAGGLGTGFMGSLAGGLNGAGVGSGLTSSIGLQIGNSIAEVVGPSVAGALSSGLGAIATAMPWVAGTAAAFAIGKAAFGHGARETTGTTLNGSLAAGSFSGTVDSTWKEKGGWFSSDRIGVDSKSVDAAMAAGLTSTYDAIKQATSAYAKSLGVNADSIANRTQALSITLGKDEAANQKAIADFFTGVGNQVARELVPNLDRFTKSGESAAATLQRLASDFQSTDQVAKLLGASSAQLFGSTGIQSAAAREQLIDAAGGLQALAQQAQSFNQNFLTDAQRIAPVAVDLDKALQGLGLSSIPATRDEFAALVVNLRDSGAAATVNGAQQLASLLGLADAFAQVHPAADAAAEATKKAADALQAMKDSADTLLGDVDGAYSVLEKVVGREKAVIQQTVDAHSAAVTRLQGLSQALHSAFDSMQSPDQMVGARAAGQAQIRAALSSARAGGALPSADSLRNALSAVQKDASGQFSSYTDYLRDLYQTQGDISALAGLTENSLSVEQSALQAAQDQLTALDNVLASAQAQVDELKGQSTTLLSIDQAIAGLGTAILAAKANPVLSATAGITNAYQQYLGRAPDAGGLAFYQDSAAKGVSIDTITQNIATSAEAQIEKAYKDVLGRAADAGGLQFYMDSLAKGVSVDSVRGMLANSDEYKKLHPFAVGTNYIPQDMPALVHQGERIIPAADNRELMRRLSSPSENSASLVAEVRALRTEVALLRATNSAENLAIAKNTGSTSDHLDAAINGDTPLATKVIPA